MTKKKTKKSAGANLTLVFLAAILVLVYFLFLEPRLSTPEQIEDSMELPALSSNDVILQYTAFTVNYNSARRIPNWVAYELTASETDGESTRQGTFTMDKSYSGAQAMREDYSNSGWDKGHMAPAADMKWSPDAMHESFYLTNVCPQNPDLNRKDWQMLERKCREWANKWEKVHIVCGPIIKDGKYGTIGERKVVIPDAFFKVVLAYDGRNYRSIGFVMDNDSARHSMKKSSFSVNSVEEITGYNFFHLLDDSIEEDVEAQNDPGAWDIK